MFEVEQSLGEGRDRMGVATVMGETRRDDLQKEGAALGAGAYTIKGALSGEATLGEGQIWRMGDFEVDGGGFDQPDVVAQSGDGRDFVGGSEALGVRVRVGIT